MAISILVNDADVTKHVLSADYRFIRNVTDKLSYCVIPFKKEKFSMEDTVKVYYGNDLKFQGLIKERRILAHAFVAQPYDTLIRLADEYATDPEYSRYESQKAGYIFKDLLDHYLTGVFDTTEIDTSVGDTISEMNLQDKRLDQCAKALADRGNCDFWLEAPDKVYFKTRDSLSNQKTIILGEDIADIDFFESSLPLRDAVTVVAREGIRATSGSGNFKYIYNDPAVLTTADAQQLADSLFEKMNVNKLEGTIPLNKLMLDLIPGKTIILNARKYGFDNSTYRLMSTEHGVDSSTLGIGNTRQFLLEQAVKKMTDLGYIQADYLTKLLEYGYYSREHLRATWETNEGDTAYWINLFGTGAVTLDVGKAFLTTGANALSSAALSTYPTVSVDWNKNPFLVAKVNIPYTSNSQRGFYMRVYNSVDPKCGFGFDVNNNTLESYSRNGATIVNENIYTIPGGGATLLLEARYYSGSRIEYFINGIWKNTHTTGLPSGSNLGLLLWITVANGSAAATDTGTIYFWVVFQDW